MCAQEHVLMDYDNDVQYQQIFQISNNAKFHNNPLEVHGDLAIMHGAKPAATSWTQIAHFYREM